MLNFLKIEFPSWFAGFKELIFSLADKLDYRMREVKISLTGNLIERELDRGFTKLGRKALEYYQRNPNLQNLNTSLFQQELEVIQSLKDKYSQALQELSVIQRKALKEALSECTDQFNRTGWGLLQIPVPENTKYAQKKIKELPLRQNILVLMVKKENRMELAHGNTVLEGGDFLICIGNEKGLADLKHLLQQREI